ncbi:MAG: diguanylate cyclase [Acidaminobacteraceae bacterium]
MSNEKPKLSINEDECLELISILNKKREYEKQIQCALSIAPLAIWSWDLKTNFFSISDELFTLIGHSKDDFDNSFEYIITNIIHPNSKLDFENAIEMDLKSGLIQTRFFRLVTSLRDECWIRINGEIIVDDDGNYSKVLGTLIDVTEDQIIKRSLESNLVFLESLFDTLPNPIFYKDNLGLYRYCNIAFLDYLGYKREEILNHSVYHIAPKELADIYHKADLELMSSKGHQTYESIVKYADGSMRDVLFSKATHLDEYGDVIGLVGIMQDVTKQNTMKRQVDMLHKVKDALLEINKSIINYSDEFEFIKVLLKKFQVIFRSCDESAVINYDSTSSFSVIKVNMDNDDDLRLKMKLRENAIAFSEDFSLNQSHIINNIRNYASKHFADLNNSSSESALVIPIKINDDLKWLLVFASDSNNVYSENDLDVANYIREELPIIFNVFNLYQETLTLSRHDPLTGLMNRGYFDTVIKDRLSTAERMNHNLIIVMFDIDKLKIINDGYGHNSGDKYIQSFTHLLEQHFRKSDAFARIGGDEFVGIFADADKDTVIEKLNDLRLIFEELKFKLYGDSFNGSVSFGLSEYPNNSKKLSELLKMSDDNMYIDKQRYNK